MKKVAEIKTSADKSFFINLFY